MSDKKTISYKEFCETYCEGPLIIGDGKGISWEGRKVTVYDFKSSLDGEGLFFRFERETPDKDVNAVLSFGLSYEAAEALKILLEMKLTKK